MREPSCGCGMKASRFLEGVGFCCAVHFPKAEPIGEWVSSSELTPSECTFAQSKCVMHVDEDGLGFVPRPWFERQPFATRTMQHFEGEAVPVEDDDEPTNVGLEAPPPEMSDAERFAKLVTSAVKAQRDETLRLVRLELRETMRETLAEMVAEEVARQVRPIDERVRVLERRLAGVA